VYFPVADRAAQPDREYTTMADPLVGQEECDRFLVELYQQAMNHPERRCDVIEIGRSVGLTPEQSCHLAWLLDSEGLISYAKDPDKPGGIATIRPKGVDAARHLKKPWWRRNADVIIPIVLTLAVNLLLELIRWMIR
jgi:hypothetical protein